MLKWPVSITLYNADYGKISYVGAMIRPQMIFLIALFLFSQAHATCLVDDYIRDGYCPGMGEDDPLAFEFDGYGNIEDRPGYDFHPDYQTPPIGLTTGEVTTIAAAAGTAILLFSSDAELMGFVQDHRTSITEELAFVGEKFGSWPIGVSAAGYVLGVVIKDDKVKRIAKVALKATIISGLITRAAKMTFSRTRPNSADSPYEFGGFDISNSNVSFPSGHTTTAFAFATIIAEHYKEKSKVIPVLAYAAATMAGWSRVHDNAHWASDVAVGALIGHLTAKLIYAHEYNTDRNEKWDMSFYPVFNSDFAGFFFEFRGKKDPKKPEEDLLFDDED